MGVARNTTRILAAREPSLTRMFEEVNAALLDEMGDDASTFVTLCGVAARRRRSERGFDLEIVCAGHPHPVLFGRGDPQGIGESSLILGVLAAPKLSASHEVLRAGEGLILYTDGLAERARGHVPVEDDPDLAAAIEDVGAQGPQAFVEAVSRLVDGGRGIDDDAAVLVVRA
jgi:serine phosphatase RsbU (regulator of sigma subunit)